MQPLHNFLIVLESVNHVFAGFYVNKHGLCVALIIIAIIIFKLWKKTSLNVYLEVSKGISFMAMIGLSKFLTSTSMQPEPAVAHCYSDDKWTSNRIQNASDIKVCVPCLQILLINMQIHVSGDKSQKSFLLYGCWKKNIFKQKYSLFKYFLFIN